jgi:hypothetical protein
MLKSALFAISALVALTSTASAQQSTPVAGPMCGERGALVGLLRSQYGEEQEDVSLQNDQALVELFASEKGTWSILLSSPNGTSCVVAAGKGLHHQARS